MKIWQRYFLKTFFKTFFLFLICFYGLYCLIDYSSHTGSMNHTPGSFGSSAIFFYYLSEFSRRFDIIVPFGLLLATARTLLLYNSRSELVALMAGGLSLRSLLTPFLCVGFAFALLSYANEEWVQPQASRYIKSVEDRYAFLKRKKRDIRTAHHIPLQEGSILLFQTYLENEELFKDLFWVRSVDQIYRIGFLQGFASPPVAHNIEVLERDPNGHLMVSSTHDALALEDLVLDKKQLMETILQPTLFPLSELWQKLPDAPKSEKEAALLSAFAKKLFVPWLSFFAILLTAPFCVTFGRQIPTFMIYACSIFALMALYLILDAGEVLSRRQLLHPIAALLIPMAVASAFPFWKYVRLR